MKLAAFFNIALTIALLPSARGQVVWSDEFDGDQIDRSNWIHDIGGHGFGNGQLEFDTALERNSYVRDGNLVIEARRESYRGKSFTSARLTTQGRFAFRYGSLEARIKMPDTADGIWPAFWMLGNNFPAIGWPHCGEIDIVEIGGKDGIASGLQHRKINCAIHFAGPDDRYALHDSWHDAASDLHLDFHHYRIDWTPKAVSFFVDDVEFGSWDITAEHFREYHQPHFVLLNVAVGGFNYVHLTRPDQVTAPFPSRMEVDWIRLTRNEHTEVVLTGDEVRGPWTVYGEQPRSGSLEYADDKDPDFPYGTGATFAIWNNLKQTDSNEPSEGDDCWTFDVAEGQWFGGGVMIPNFRNMARFSDGFLHFDIKTTSSAHMKVGIKSSRGGESFLPLGDDSAEFGFARDGQWHEVVVPLNRFANIDFRTVHQLFMLAGDPPKSSFRFSIDNVWWEESSSRPGPTD